ncbi:MAG: GHKL domain-containing protein [Candidatus Marinimicrobia bacterium]|jgi:two-component system, NtrC family, nitrogen regulation sensor histidine kinase NtrY|nr:GHKL domain-containing protein [Candidatus Neomarinimicrobiota bacterium]MBT4685085.1 GHKL domain-containing protein [Candidatus Neomarinimicrobiota bacterium]MBT6938634.1 GHKL domain-containing protein [Candidatus Neomarinimicrobiota bacterium]
MKFPLPSFRLQIVFIVLFLVINSALFFRNYFLESFQTYSSTTDSLEINEKINHVYTRYNESIFEKDRSDFKSEIEDLLITQQQTKLTRDYFKDELALSSIFIFIFITTSVLVLFIFSFNLISKPIKNLQDAAEKLGRGEMDIQIKENPFSPLNHLIQSFNSMILELNTSREKLIEAEKDSAWRGMARIMAHEIKNPLTPIKLSLERMETKFYSASTNFHEVFQKTTAVIHEEINNLHTLAKEFSEFARLPKAHVETIDLNFHLKEILSPYGENHTISIVLSKESPTILADKNQFKQLIVNIIQNAIHASQNENKIEVSTHENDLGEIAILIRDYGLGIAEENLKNIFEPYFTDKKKGTGLGLAIVKKIMLQHDGRIQVESQLNKGTTFSLYFKIINS